MKMVSRGSQSGADEASFDHVDRRLESWIRGVVQEARISFELPPEREGMVSLYLLELAEDPPPRGMQAAPLRLALRYLVTTWGEPAEAHRTLGKLVFAALAEPELQVDLHALSVASWPALGVAPRPAFIVQLSVHRERGIRIAPPVTQGVEVRTRSIGHLEGIVVGPGGIPLAGAVVSVPHMGKRATTDARGAFRLSGLPASPPIHRLLVRAKGHEQAVMSDTGFAGDRPVEIRIDFPEGQS